MKKLILLGLVSLVLAGCSRSVAYTVVHREPVDDRIVNQRIIEERTNFLNLVIYMRSNKEVNEQTKLEVMKYIENAGFVYRCEGKFDCFIYRNNLKVRVFPDHIYIEYPDKSYKKIWDANLATNLIYS